MASLTGRSAGMRLSFLTFAMLVFAIPVFLVAWMAFGVSSLESSLMAWAGCWLVGILSIAAMEPIRRADWILYRVGVGTLIRLFGLLGLCFLVDYFGSSLFQSGFIVYLLIFYVVGLTLETLLVVGSVPWFVGKSCIEK
jgi:hypothetical protein